jgi:crotonobetainyl-CoA:carnitine CoA-transferase CaiB-like acyl-CoA transferase
MSRVVAPLQPKLRDMAGKPPMSGFTILEFASFLAAPLGATLMAELGARVIKVEPLEGDMFRKTGLEYVHIGNGKESIALDLKDPRALQIVDRLISKSDVLLHNFRPGVPERLGIAYERVSKINPRLIYLYGASYGSRGPEKHRPAFHPMPNALTGGGILQAGKGNPPVNDSYSDPCAGLAVGAALAIGLYAREVTGQGQYMETTMLTSACWVHSEQIVNYRNRPARPELDQQQLGYGALNRLYKCSEGWIMLVARNDNQVSALAKMFGQPSWVGIPAAKLSADEAVGVA